MSVIGFIANNWDAIVLVGGAVGGWLGITKKKATAKDLRELALKLGRQAFTKLLHDARVYDDDHVRRVITNTIWAGLDRLGVKKSTALDKLVREAAEHVKGELAELVFKHHIGELQKPLERTVSKLESVTGTL